MSISLTFTSLAAMSTHWSQFSSGPSVFSPNILYTTFDPTQLLPETPFRNKFLSTMALPFERQAKFFFQILNEQSPSGKMNINSMFVT
jgi:hypothetical protein